MYIYQLFMLFSQSYIENSLPIFPRCQIRSRLFFSMYA